MNPEVVILAATRMEIDPFLRLATFKRETLSPVGRAIIELGVAQQRILVMVTGPGLVNTAQALTMALERFKPRLVIQSGIAGVFEQAGLEPGDIGIAQWETYVHTGIENPHISQGVSSLPFDLIPGNPESRQGRFPVSQKHADHALKVLKHGFSREKLTIMKAGIITVSTVTASDASAQWLFSNFHQPCMEAMEGAASAQVAALYKIDFMEIRTGSNRVGNRDKSVWQIPLAVTRLSTALLHLLKDCDFHPPGL
ncbi:MAG: futalosine hydrolase [Desulfobacterium sp.]|jgi:futalosine hydrolase|nr:futalosine hydrolase [Desulfobacterium sp.]